MNVISNHRCIRVFISSTFVDMKQERDILVSTVFPKLRRKAAERNVSLIDVDLRWGVTESESKERKVIDICIDEIERSHPFFVGFYFVAFFMVEIDVLLTKPCFTLKNTVCSIPKL